jgi:hypothetical protein
MKAMFSTVKIVFSILGDIHQISKLGAWNQIDGVVDYVNQKDLHGHEKKESAITTLDNLLEKMPMSRLNLAIEIAVAKNRK